MVTALATAPLPPLVDAFVDVVSTSKSHRGAPVPRIAEERPRWFQHSVLNRVRTRVVESLRLSYTCPVGTAVGR